VSWNTLALFPRQLDGARATVRRTDEAKLAGALHPDRHSEMYGSVLHAAKEDEPIKRQPVCRVQGRVRLYLSRCTSSEIPMNVIRPSNAMPRQLLHA